jgi:hypothetical protein
MGIANRRLVGGLDLFEDRVRSGFTVTYFDCVHALTPTLLQAVDAKKTSGQVKALLPQSD